MKTFIFLIGRQRIGSFSFDFIISFAMIGVKQLYFHNIHYIILFLLIIIAAVLKKKYIFKNIIKLKINRKSLNFS